MSETAYIADVCRITSFARYDDTTRRYDWLHIVTDNNRKATAPQGYKYNGNYLSLRDTRQMGISRCYPYGQQLLNGTYRIENNNWIKINEE